ncbi:MAG: sel1 repeat family protein [Desulfomonile tiedjei]|uniref:Sel1 repeat family protein n=1 Tax=Desulfomonile tiedjei TaxID=2358 RepID=A0A9D6V7D7_9BACT|nr:sel1 repeat family protein [Desulfomonile tiedjei]
MYVIIIIAVLAFGYWVYKNSKRNAVINEFCQAAEEGDADAQFEMGVLYQYGRGVRQNLFEAVSLYCKAAEQGHIGAQSNLGVLYTLGLGIPRDYSQALYWFTKAANQGNAFAQNNLCRLYSFGEGVPQNYVTAYMWLELAINGLEGAEKEKAEMNRDRFLTSHMNSEEIERAKKMAVEWRASHKH